jgi:hypothetical protein
MLDEEREREKRIRENYDAKNAKNNAGMENKRRKKHFFAQFFLWMLKNCSGIFLCVRSLY